MGSAEEAKKSDSTATQRKQPHLRPQDAKTVDPSKLTALSAEVVRIYGLIENKDLKILRFHDKRQ